VDPALATYTSTLAALQSQANQAYAQYQAALAAAGCPPGTAPRTSDSFVVFGAKVSFPYQRQIWIESTDGAIYHPQDGATLVSALNEIKSKNAKLKVLIIKGHGGYDTIENGARGDVLSAPQNNITGTHDIYSDINGQPTYVTRLFLDVTDVRSRISLRGCYSDRLARQIADALSKNRVTVDGGWGPQLGIPGTTISIGIRSRYGGGDE
jgi:hypothetical protein